MATATLSKSLSLETLTEEEFRYVCSIIPLTVYIDYFKHTTKKFNTIMPGFRPDKFKNSKKVIDVVYKNRNNDYISSFLENQVTHWLEDINKSIEETKNKDACDYTQAVLRTLPSSFFCDRADIYFKLIQSDYNDDYISLIKESVFLITVMTKSKENSDEKLTKTTEQYTEAKEKWDKCTKLLANQKEEKQRLTDKYEQAKLDKVSIQIKSSALEGQITALEKNISQLTNEVNSAKQKISALESDRNVSWQKFKADKQKEAENDLAEIKSETDKLYAEYSDLEQRKAELSDELSDLEVLRKEHEDLSDKIDNLKAIIQDAEENTISLQNQAEENDSEIDDNQESEIETETETFEYSDLIKGVEIEADAEIVTEDGLLELLRDNLAEAGVGADESRKSLSAFLLSAYLMKNPLIIAGYGAVELVDSLSASLKNHMADRVYYTNNPATICACDSDSIIAVYDGLSAIDKILDLAGDRYVCFICTTSEELQIEPRSIYNYALPLFTEYFISKKITGAYDGGICEEEPDYEFEKKERLNFIKGYLPEYAYLNAQQTISMAKAINDISDYDIFKLTALPILLSLSKREELLHIIGDSKLSDDNKRKIRQLIGETE
jgi:predicted  nucleic acid-binding Zn-ribbon protein